MTNDNRLTWKDINEKRNDLKSRISALDNQIDEKQRQLILPRGFCVLGVVAFGTGMALILYGVPGGETVIGSATALTTQAYQGIKDTQKDLEQLKQERSLLKIQLQQLQLQL